MTYRALVGYVLFAFFVLCRPVFAARGEEEKVRRAKVHLEAGVSHFNAGQYELAARQMEEAYRLRPSAEMQFNLAHCYERTGELDKAITAYRGYLGVRQSAEDRKQVEQRIEKLEAALASRPQVPEVEPPPAATVTDAPAAKEAPSDKETQEKVVFKTIVVYREPPPKAGRSARFAALGLLGVTLAGLSSGVAFAVVAQRTKEQTEAGEAEFIQNQKNTLDIYLSRRADMMAMMGRQLGPPFITQEQLTLDHLCQPGGLFIDPEPLEPMDRPTSLFFTNGVNSFCNFRRISQDAYQAGVTSAAVGFGVATIAGVGALGFYLYGRRLDKKQAAELAGENQKRAGQVRDLALYPLFSSQGGGFLVSGRY